MFMGIDIGSSSSKVVIINKNKEIIGSSILNIGTGTDGPERCLEEALMMAKINKEQIEYSVATGYGRNMYKNVSEQITEISCHAKGVAYLIEGASTIIDIGGQDAKVIKLDKNGRVENFVMNDKCAAGTGRFLEVMARILNCSLSELSELSKTAEKEVAISNTCTVFAESEVISQLSSGASKENVAKGALRSVAARVAGLCGRVGVSPVVIMTGGVALNSEVAKALSAEIDSPIVVAENPQRIGALGAALFAYERCNK